MCQPWFPVKALSDDNILRGARDIAAPAGLKTVPLFSIDVCSSSFTNMTERINHKPENNSYSYIQCTSTMLKNSGARAGAERFSFSSEKYIYEVYLGKGAEAKEAQVILKDVRMCDEF